MFSVIRCWFDGRLLLIRPSCIVSSLTGEGGGGRTVGGDWKTITAADDTTGVMQGTDDEGSEDSRAIITGSAGGWQQGALHLTKPLTAICL